jgi:Kef-type K+ transport system membrane component KefB
MDSDRQAGQRMQLAALMLRRGDDFDEIADATDVPFAMLELLRDQLDHRVARACHVILTAVIIEVVAVANILTCVLTLIRHDSGLGVLTGVIATVLIVAAYLVARPAARTLRTTARDRPPPQG